MTRWWVMYLRTRDGDMRYCGSTPLDSVQVYRVHHTAELIAEAAPRGWPKWVKHSCVEAGGHDLAKWQREEAEFEASLAALSSYPLLSGGGK